MSRGDRCEAASQDGAIQITLRTVDGCPHRILAEERLRHALAAPDAPMARIAHERVGTQAEAERVGFRGSPTILLDGHDPFAEAGDPVGLACRVYRNEEGVEGAPSLARLRAALRRATADAANRGDRR